MTTITDLSEWENDPRLFLFTSLTAGSSHIVSATSRLETILKANRIPFHAVDVATHEKARKLWGRRASKKKLPGLVKEGYVIGDLEEIEEWNEFGELHDNIGPVPADASGALPGDGVHAVQNTLGSLRMHDAASQAANAAPLPPLKSTPGAKASPAASKAPVSAPGGSAAKSSERIATPLVAIAKAEKEAESISDSKPATGDEPKSDVQSTLKEEKSDATKDAGDTTGTTKAQRLDEADGVQTQGIEIPVISEASAQPSVTLDEPQKTGTTALSPAPDSQSTTSDVPLPTPLSPSPSEPVGVVAGSISNTHRGSSISVATAEEIKKIEDAAKIDEEEEDGHEAAST